jgi:hypothetical protein
MRSLAVERRMNMNETVRVSRHGVQRMFKLGWLVLLVIAMMAPTGAWSQLTGKGAITGTVTDKTGAVIPNADISATSDSTGITTATKSTGAGAYTFSALDPANYSVTIAAPGFEKLAQKNIHVNAMESSTYNPVLTVGGSDVQITVTAAPPQLETSNATLGATMENEMYAELPIEMGAYGQADQRRATDFAFLMPGVQGNNTTGNATTNTGVVNGSGSKGAVSAVYIDGIPFVRAGGNGDPRFVWTAISVDAVDQFQVQTTGYPAIYEGQGVMNYTIKAGGNKYHASVYEFFRNTSLDTWGFWGKAANTVTGAVVKPVEHSNEYGINIGGPLVPFGKWKDKVFVFGNYNGYRYTSATPTPITLPTAAQQAGDFTATKVNIYDPLTQAACTAANTANKNAPCRYQYSYNGVANVIDPTKFSSVAKAMQSFLPTGIGTAVQNNYIASNPTGLINWSTTERIDYFASSKDTLSLLFADGRQASSNPVGQSTTGRNVGPVPYNYGQAYAPKTIVAAIEETHTFSPNLLNQFKLGYARYNGPTFSSNQQPSYSASKMGITGQPTGQAQDAFPIVTFAGTDAPTGWSGTNANVTIAQNYTLLDNVQWNVGKHSFTFGGQTAWMLYNVLSATGASTPLTLAYAVTETAALPGTYTVTPGTGLSYASYLVGEPDKGTFTQYVHPVIGTRFRPISGYVQDNWKVSQKLTLDLGLRYDFFPTLTEVNNAMSYFNPNLANPITGINGALEFTGHGANTCNCSTPVDNYYKNLGPRFGAAYQLNSKTVVRSSYGVMFTHGGAVGGSATTLGGGTVNNGLLGFSSSPSFSVNGSDLSTIPLHGANGVIPTYTLATGAASGPAYGTGYTNTTNYTSTPSAMGYADKYLGSRAPEFINWSFGIQRQLKNALTLTTTYVGSEGHFLPADGSNARGYWADQLDPKYLYLGSALGDKGTTIATDCTTYSLPCPSNFNTSQQLNQALKPFPFQTVADAFGYVSNSHYQGLQTVVNMRTWHGLTINSNFTWSRSIDNGGTFRTGYAIPAGTLANDSTKSYKADAIEKSVSTSNQPLHFVLTTVWNWPFGKTILNSNTMERAVLGGFKFSGIYQAYSGSPLTLTESTCQTNQAQSTCQPIMNPNFTGSARQNGKWGHGATTANYTSTNYVVPSTGTTVSNAAGPFMNPVSTVLSSYAYKFSDAPRTAPYNLNGPGNYQLDLALVRSFPLHITEASKLNFRAEWYNVTNHTLFGVASTAVGNASFGQVTVNTAAARKAAQFSARIEF